MTRAICFDSFGGPEVLQYRELCSLHGRTAQARVAHRAWRELHRRVPPHRFYPLTPPERLGGEGAGVSGRRTRRHARRRGDRVAYTRPRRSARRGRAKSRCEVARQAAPCAERAERCGDDAEGSHGVVPLKRSYRVAAGDWLLLYAAAGGVGLIAAQCGARARRARHRRGRSGQTSSSRSSRVASTCCSTATNPAARARAHKRRCAVVYDSVGRTTCFQSLDCRGRTGSSSASVTRRARSAVRVCKSDEARLAVRDPADALRLHSRFSRARRRGPRAIRSRRERSHRDRGPIRPIRLRDAAQAHRDLEARRTTGCTVLIP